MRRADAARKTWLAGGNEEGPLGPAVVNLSDGTFKVGGKLLYKQNASFNLDSGEFHTDVLDWEEGATGFDINDGIWTLTGNVTGDINDIVDAGGITAYNGTGTVVVDYNANTFMTEVTGTPP